MSGKVRDYSKLAKDILEAVGGEGNVISAARCATRLRLVLKKTTDEMKQKVAAMPGVITVVEKGGQFQVVIGQHVGTVFEQFSELGHRDDVRCICPIYLHISCSRYSARNVNFIEASFSGI